MKNERVSKVIPATRGRNKRVKQLKWLAKFTFLAFMCVIISIIALLSYTRMQGPPPMELAFPTQFFANDGSMIDSEEAGQNRTSVSLEEMSPYLVDATIAIEDRKFFSHYGFDIKRIGGAILANVQSGSKEQGASTITQQYARNLYLSHEKTYLRKWNELLYALRLEMNFSKEEILEGYLNTIYYGHGNYGIEAASMHFFGKPAKNLSLAEATMIAGVPKGPSYYSPLNDLDRATSRQHTILTSMVEAGAITEQEADQAKQEKLHFVDQQAPEAQEVAPYFQDHVKALMKKQASLTEEQVKAGGLSVQTTLDPKLQQQAEELIEQHMPENELQVALVAIDPRTNEVKALVGGKDYEDSAYNRATQSKRHPGSTMKPFLYYAALENGFTPMTTFLSEPTSFTFDEGREKYEPSNYNDIYANDYITMLEAISYSDNIFAVKTHLSIGEEQLVQVAESVGLGTLKQLPSLALGAQPVSILDMANAYTALANGGKMKEPVFIKSVADGEGTNVFEQTEEQKQVLRADTTFILTDMMQGVFEPELNSYTSVTGGSVSKKLSHPTAGKSGSTPRDSWMIGYTPQLVTVVWTGYDEKTDINQFTEGQVAKRIWADFMQQAMEDELTLPFTRPSGVVMKTVDPHTGLLSNEACPGGRPTAFLMGTEPLESCSEPEETEPNEKETKPDDGLFRRFFRWIGGNEEESEHWQPRETEER
ncbi:transglycosylase domain-containing protein [Shouchella sp. JSM 1781072]|uniref:transglycosylase domain-containing protein n=1 Tax=Shouchella sp. JSM 1781072 TaxID=3344581 RepID=UPI0035BFD6FC